MKLLCYMGFHDSEIVLNLKNNKITRICKRCRKILEVAKNGSCCGSCIAKDMNWREQLKKSGKVINI